MKRDLLIAGDNFWIKNILYNLGRDYNLQKISDAKTGLAIVLNKEFQLIMVGDDIALNEQKDPYDFEFTDTVEVGCYFIREVRKSKRNSNTPIIVSYGGNFRGYDDEIAVKKYLESGVNGFVNWFKRTPEIDVPEYLEVAVRGNTLGQ